MSALFHNVSNEMLADMIGELDAKAKLLEAQCKEVKDELKRRQVVEACGERFTVKIAETTSRTLDTDKVKALLGAELADYQKITTSMRLSIKPVVRFDLGAVA